MKNINGINIELSPCHIYKEPTLPKAYDFVPWSMIMHSIKNSPYAHSGTFIDIGANVGDSLAHIRSFDAETPVVCVEPSQGFFELLRKNSSQFNNVTLYNSLLVPEKYRGQVVYEFDDQTGSTRLKDFEDEESGIFCEALSFDDLMIDEGVYFVKTDTDGFDRHIVSSLLSEKEAKRLSVPLIFFEGPTETDNPMGDFEEWFILFQHLVADGYNLLFLQNFGIPYAYGGNSVDMAKAILVTFYQSFLYKRPVCHYLDVIAFTDEIKNDYLSLLKFWPIEWQDGYI